jgi:uncharacterized membrane-anchored protein
MHGVAQRYYRSAAQFAAQAGDLQTYATVLRGLSVQAHALGHRREALNLAEAAVHHRRFVPGADIAFLSGQLALAVDVHFFGPDNAPPLADENT